jgi:sterol desaturase/sphingolipid hydroxylase (fatty acid hydroxylase superfamily)
MVITEIVGFLWASLQAVARAAELLAISAVLFGLLALLVKGWGAVEAARRAAPEVTATLWLELVNVIVFAPVISMAIALWLGVIDHYSLAPVDESVWSRVGDYGTFVAVIFVGDFLGYCRHRAQHTRWFWPAHAIHHSDTQMTWVTLSRFHPLDNFTTNCFDFGCLALLGFPHWALVANAIVRTYYGQFIHADLPFTYGPFARVFVSPVMHRWHHARDVEGAGSNFATVFSVFDRAFGTYYVPGLCTVPLGVADEIRPSTVGRLLHPLRSWFGGFFRGNAVEADRIESRISPGQPT